MGPDGTRPVSADCSNREQAFCKFSIELGFFSHREVIWVSNSWRLMELGFNGGFAANGLRNVRFWDEIGFKVRFFRMIDDAIVPNFG